MSTTSTEAQQALLAEMARLIQAMDAGSLAHGSGAGLSLSVTGAGTARSLVVRDAAGGTLHLSGDFAAGDITALRGMVGSFSAGEAGWRVPDSVASAWATQLARVQEISPDAAPAATPSARPVADAASVVADVADAAAAASQAFVTHDVPVEAPEDDAHAMQTMFGPTMKSVLDDMGNIGGMFSPGEITKQASRMDANFDPTAVKAAGEAADAAAVAQQGAEQAQAALASKAAKPVREKSTTGLLTADQQKMLDEALAELDELIGLDDIKAQINRQVATLKMRLLRERQGLSNAETTQHMLFMGNPGTGKTTVARIMGKIFFALGVLDKGHVVETNREGLVAEYQGQTAGKTTRAVEEAIGGILFLDEMYALTPDGATDTYGQEALSTLLQHMENRRGEFIVIGAGYTDDMLRMIASNFGLTSRFPNQVTFKDFTSKELADVFCRMSGGSDYTAADDVREQVLQIASLMIACADKSFGNARDMRNLFDRTIEEHAQRIVALDDSKDGDVAKSVLETLSTEDVESADRALTGYQRREDMRKALAGEPVQGLEPPEGASEIDPVALDASAAGGDAEQADDSSEVPSSDEATEPAGEPAPAS